MKIYSPAKINLFLKIISNDNSYHQIQSLLAYIDLVDEIEILESQEFKLEIISEFKEHIDIKNNIFTEILNHFEENFNTHKNFHIKLQKNIPIGAGMGGGSSNGAALIKFLNSHFSLNLSKKEMQEISLNFGSDIAFFFEDKSSLISGRGEEIINYKNFKEIPALLINPKIHLSTKEVFDGFSEEFSQKTDFEEFLNQDIEELISLENDLEDSSIKLCFHIKEILNNLIENKAIYSKMSGSGSTCFGIFRNSDDLNSAYDIIKEKYPKFLVKKIKIFDEEKKAISRP